MRRRDRPCRTPDDQGFTLIEVLVALAVTALTLVAAGQALRVVTTTAGRGIAAMNRLDGDVRGIAVLRADLARLERFVKVEHERAQFDFLGERQRIGFPLVEPGFPTDPGTFWVEYRVQKAGGMVQVVRSREPYAQKRTRRSAEGGDDSVIVLEGKYDVAFSYEERAGDKVRWVDGWTDKTRLPALIRVVLSGGGGPAAPPPMMLRPRVDAELGCADAEAGTCTPRNGGGLIESQPQPSQSPSLAPPLPPRPGRQP